MPEYNNNMRGVLFKNPKKKSDKHPDYTGQCEIEGVEYWLSAWIQEARKTGEKFMSLAFTRKESKKQTPPEEQAANRSGSDIPF